MAEKAKKRKMVVVVEEMVQLPFRSKSEPATRTYTVWATTRSQAVRAVRDAGYKGRLVQVIVND